MKSISKLKDEARRYEQREEWEKAIEAYLQVIRNADEGEADVELPLYNRVGDLCVRLGKPQEAVRHYEQAADRYAEAGLYNNAIALCNKALRYNPDRLELVRKLGQFSASQGFITDARRYFLDYAERQFNAGKVTEALNALEDFANVSDDPEIREMLGRQLQAHGRINDAVDELRRAHAMRLQAGQTDLATGLRAEILAIDPNATIGGEPPPVSEAPRAVEGDLPLVEIEPDFGTDATAGADTHQGSVADPAALDVGGFDADLADVRAAGEADAIEGLETTTFDFGSVTDDAPTLDELGLQRDESTFGTDATRDAETFELPEPEARDEHALPELDPEATFELPELEADSPAPGGSDAFTLHDDGAAFDLPLLDEPERTFDLPLLDEDGTGAPDIEATPVPPPAIDDDPAVEATGAELADADLGGDLPLDLSAFGGFGTASFELTPDASADADAEEDTTPSWEAPAETFDTPEPDEGLELPTWEPEPGPDLDLPSYDDVPGSDDDEVEDITSALEADSRQDADVLDIPAIELPTWDTGPIPAAEEGEEDRASPEPDWVETSAAEVDEPETQLPTFTYEEEPEPIQRLSDDDERTADGDPLGLRAHIPHVPGAAEPEAEADPEAADWLDDIADDEPPAALPAQEPGENLVDGVGGGDPDATVAYVSLDESAREAETREAAEGAPAAARAGAGPEPARKAREDDGFIDLGALVTEDDDQETTRFRVQETAPTGDEDRDFAELLNQFKSKVQEHLPAEDAGAHYDLGLAFKEMGLIDEAIGEFQVALRSGHMRLRVYEELGDCFLQKEQYNIAEKVLSRALDMKFEDELELLGVYYHLGRAYEALGKRDQARDAYERVLGMDINFGDVTARLARL